MLNFSNFCPNAVSSFSVSSLSSSSVMSPNSNTRNRTQRTRVMLADIDATDAERLGYMVIKKIGTTWHGDVFECIDEKNGHLMSVHRCEIGSSDPETQVGILLRDINVKRRLSHPFIYRYFGSQVTVENCACSSEATTTSNTAESTSTCEHNNPPRSMDSTLKSADNEDNGEDSRATTTTTTATTTTQFYTREFVELFFERCYGTTLRGFLRSLPRQRLTARLAQHYTRQILKALSYIHAQGDAKFVVIGLDNVLVSACGSEIRLQVTTGESAIAQVVVCNKSKFTEQPHRNDGSDTNPMTCAPEVFVASGRSGDEAAASLSCPSQQVGERSNKGSTEQIRDDDTGEEVSGSTSARAEAAINVWSLGCLVVEMFGGVPWRTKNLSLVQIITKIANSSSELPDGIPLPRSDQEHHHQPLQPCLLEFLRLCFKRDPKQRATVEELLGSSWMQMKPHQLAEPEFV